MRRPWLLLLASLALLACERTRDTTARAAPTLAPDAPPPSASPPDADAPDAPDADAPDADATEAGPGPATLPAGQPPPGREIHRFHAALRALEARSAPGHVRIAWLGDSHAQADFWSGTLRQALQERFGRAGPGYVYLGYKSYRHEEVSVGGSAAWKMRPSAPATSSRTDDGVFGLGGVLTRAVTSKAQVWLTTTGEPPAPRMRVDLCYRLPSKGDALSVRAGNAKASATTSAEAPEGTVQHLTLEADAPMRLEVVTTSGRPELCGAVIETDPATHPGVVLDTLGINGARYGTALAWDEAAWTSELSRRSPDLVILEYGTNEAGAKQADPARYAVQIGQLVARVRRAAPRADCVVLSLTDRTDTAEMNPRVRDAQRDGALASGCMFWDTYAIMGGKGGMRKWFEGPKPLAAGDGVHLAPRGYRKLGDRLHADLMKGY